MPELLPVPGGNSLRDAQRSGDPEAPCLLTARLRYTIGELSLAVDFSLRTRHAVLFGASGAGKSTVLRLLAGLQQPDSGCISSAGRLLTDTAARISVPPGRRGIGYLTQDPALFPHLTVEENVAYGLHTLPRHDRRTRLAALLDSFSLEDLRLRLPVRLSGGERQRVALARALAPRPSLLLLDEPFVALDAERREETAAALEHHLEVSQAMVLSVSHDVAEVYAKASATPLHVLLLEHGRIASEGDAATVLAHHRERLLRQLGASLDAAPARALGR
ncbi:MAG TPA: ATP-binding cassette domain-containing protein [Acidobacteriaceae bacterium]